MEELEISSFSNPKYKELKALSKSRNRKQANVFLMEGRPELDIAFRLGWEPNLLVYTDSYIDAHELQKVAGTSKARVIKVSKALFDDLAYQRVPNNFIAQFNARHYSLDSVSVNSPIVVLESVEKPGNLGAILRTCDGAGIKTVLVTESEIDLYNPNVLRNSRGAAFSVETVFCSNEQALAFIKKNGLVPYAAALTEKAKDFKSIEPTTNAALILGAESTGLSDFWMENAIEHLVIPMRGVVDSLNVSVSAAILIQHFQSS